MSHADELDRSLLHLRLESFLAARFGVSATLRPRAASDDAPPDLVRTAPEFAGAVWIVFADERSPRAVGIRLQTVTTLSGAPRYEVFECPLNGPLCRSI